MEMDWKLKQQNVDVFDARQRRLLDGMVRIGVFEPKKPTDDEKEPTPNHTKQEKKHEAREKKG